VRTAVWTERQSDPPQRVAVFHPALKCQVEQVHADMTGFTLGGEGQAATESASAGVFIELIASRRCIEQIAHESIGAVTMVRNDANACRHPVAEMAAVIGERKQLFDDCG